MLYVCYTFLLLFYQLGILGTKAYRKPEWVTQMEEMQEALKGNYCVDLDVANCMPSGTECSFSRDSLDDHGLRDSESSQKDSSTMISEFSSTKTLMNISDDVGLSFDEDKTASKERLLLRRYSDSIKIEKDITADANIQYSSQIDTSRKEQTPIAFDLTMRLHEIEQNNVKYKYISHTLSLKNKRSVLVKSITNNMNYESDVKENYTEQTIIKGISASSLNTQDVKHPERKQSVKTPSISKEPFLIKTECVKPIIQKNIIDEPLATMKSFNIENTYVNEQTSNISRQYKKKKIVLDFNEFPPSKYEKKIQEQKFHSDTKETTLDEQKSPFYLSLFAENNEIPSVSDQNKLKINRNISEEFIIKSTYCKQKYHTYPMSKIPVSKRSINRKIENYTMDPRMFPLEPREIDLESFQQLHTVDSQEELQEFLLLESQCGNLGLASTTSTSKMFDEYSTEERSTMSGRSLFKTNNKNLYCFENNHA